MALFVIDFHATSWCLFSMMRSQQDAFFRLTDTPLYGVLRYNPQTASTPNERTSFSPSRGRSLPPRAPLRLCLLKLPIRQANKCGQGSADQKRCHDPRRSRGASRPARRRLHDARGQAYIELQLFFDHSRRPRDRSVIHSVRQYLHLGDERRSADADADPSNHAQCEGHRRGLRLLGQYEQHGHDDRRPIRPQPVEHYNDGSDGAGRAKITSSQPTTP